MKLEEEKMLVTLKLLNYPGYQDEEKRKYFQHDGYDIDNRIYLSHWNPQSERKWWDEIYAKLTNEQWLIFINEIAHIIVYHSLEENERFKMILTVKPETCWKALIKTLEPNEKG